ncbi:MAG: outer membrane beta-barrel protein [Gemmatimonadota bacterium]
MIRVVLRNALSAALGAALTAGALAPVGAAAQNITSPYRFIETQQEVSIFGGAFKAETGPLGMGPGSGSLYGGRWGIRVSGPFVFEVEAAYLPTSRTVVDTARVDPENGDSSFMTLGKADANLVLGQVGLRFDMVGPRTWHGFTPFLRAGGGVAIDLSGTDDNLEGDLPASARFDFGTTFAGELAGGVEYYFSPNVGVRVDARTLLWKLEVPDEFRLLEQERGVTSASWEQQYVLTAGLSVHF